MLSQAPPDIRTHIALPQGAVITQEARIAHTPSDHVSIPYVIGGGVIEEIAIKFCGRRMKAHTPSMTITVIGARHAIASWAFEALIAYANTYHVDQQD